MGNVQSAEELMKYISVMDRDNSVVQFSIPGKGKFTLILQEEDERTIKADACANPELEKMIKESQRQYKQGKGMSTTELLQSLSPKDFM